MKAALLRLTCCMAIAFSVGGCAYADRILFKTFAGEEPAEANTTVEQSFVLDLGVPAPGLRKGNFRPRQVAASQTSNTKVGRAIALQRVALMDLNQELQSRNGDLQFLRRSLTVDTNGYRAAVAKLGLKTGDALPPNDALFSSNTEDMRRRLNRIHGDLLKMNGLASKVTVVAAKVAQQLEKTRDIKTWSGPTDRDREHLLVLEQETDDTLSLAHGFLSELHLDIGAYTKYASDQRRRLDSLIARVAGTSSPPATKTNAAMKTGELRSSAQEMGGGPKEPPLLVIRFDRPDVAYTTPLREAVNTAIEQQADAQFRIVGVSPRSENGTVTTAAMARALQVKHAMSEMGMSDSRLHLSSMNDGESADDEVRVYVDQTTRNGKPHVADAGSHGSDTMMRPRGSKRPAHQMADASAKSKSAAPMESAKMPKEAHTERPLITIRFVGAGDAYQKELREAVQAALDRRPGAHFDLVAIAAGQPDFAKGAAAAMARADAVSNDLVQMGLPTERMTLEATSEAESGVDQVMIFVR